MMIMGIPNVGKSTLMNALLKRKVAAVGDEPAVTKSQQCLDLGPGMTLTDTPGLMWPKIEHDSDGYMLAAPTPSAATQSSKKKSPNFSAALLLARYPDRLKQRYGFDTAGLDGHGVVEAVAKRRGCILKGKGGGYDLEKAAMVFLTDFRDGALGRDQPGNAGHPAAMLAAK